MHVVVAIHARRLNSVQAVKRFNLSLDNVIKAPSQPGVKNNSSKPVP
jgi:hypothetical protein